MELFLKKAYLRPNMLADLAINVVAAGVGDSITELVAAWW